MWYCICDNKDGCNKSNNIHENLKMVLILPLLFFFFTHFLPSILNILSSL